MNANLEQQIVRLAFTQFEELPQELAKLGFKAEIYDNGDFCGVDAGSMKASLPKNTTIPRRAIQLAFLVCGPQWQSVVPNFLQAVGRGRFERV